MVGCQTRHDTPNFVSHKAPHYSIFLPYLAQLERGMVDGPSRKRTFIVHLYTTHNCTCFALSLHLFCTIWQKMVYYPHYLPTPTTGIYFHTNAPNMDLVILLPSLSSLLRQIFWPFFVNRVFSSWWVFLLFFFFLIPANVHGIILEKKKKKLSQLFMMATETGRRWGERDSQLFLN